MIYTSPYTLPPKPKVGLFDFVFSNNSHVDWDRKAVVDISTNASITYRALRALSLSLASGLTSNAHLTRGETLLIFAPNSIIYPALALAGQAAGLTVSTANSAYTPEELAHALTLSGAKVVVCGGDLVGVAREACALVGIGDQRVFVLPGMDGKEGKMEGAVKSWEELKRAEEFEPVKWSEEELATRPAYILFSSGTTGPAKAVGLSSLNVLTNLHQAHACGWLSPNVTRVAMAAVPMYHALGLVNILQFVLSQGGTVVTMPRFDLVMYLAGVAAERATIAWMVPPMLLALAKAPPVEKFDLTSLKYVVAGAAPVPPAIQIAASARLRKMRAARGKEGATVVGQGWGMSEVTCTGFAQDPSVADELETGKVGQIWAGMEARLVDIESGRDVNEGEAGELWVRGPNLMMGYVGNAAATGETFSPDGWLKTGDIFARSPNGEFSVVDRAKELIKYNGFQVPPAELEALLLTNAEVGDVAVIGVWSEEGATELPRAYVVPAPGVEIKGLEGRLVKFVEGRAARHKWLRGGVRLVEAIPKSPSGKILRRLLRGEVAREEEPAKARL